MFVLQWPVYTVSWHKSPFFFVNLLDFCLVDKRNAQVPPTTILHHRRTFVQDWTNCNNSVCKGTLYRKMAGSKFSVTVNRLVNVKWSLLIAACLLILIYIYMRETNQSELWDASEKSDEKAFTEVTNRRVSNLKTVAANNVTSTTNSNVKAAYEDYRGKVV